MNRESVDQRTCFFLIYTVFHKKVSHFYFTHNFVNCSDMCTIVAYFFWDTVYVASDMYT